MNIKYAVMQNAKRDPATSIVYGEVMTQHRKLEKARESLERFSKVHSPNLYTVVEWSSKLGAYVFV